MASESVSEQAPLPEPPESLNLAVLLGGPSHEREVSLVSGRAVADALCSRGHHVRTIDPAEVDLTQTKWDRVDGVFVALHGRFGEDGQVQALLDELHVAYTGSGPEASRLAMDKRASKAMFFETGVPTPDWQSFERSDSVERIQAKAASLGYPLVVKPACNGSSLGISLVGGPDELGDALDECFEFEQYGLMERLIQGRELTVGVLDRQALPIIELVTSHRFYDYQAKYVGGTRYLFDTGLSDELYHSVQQTALKAFRVLGCRHFGRVDLMLDPRGKAWVLEVNTIPGFTSHSLLPKAAGRADVPFDELCDRIVQLAMTFQRVG